MFTQHLNRYAINTLTKVVSDFEQNLVPQKNNSKDNQSEFWKLNFSYLVLKVPIII